MKTTKVFKRVCLGGAFALVATAFGSCGCNAEKACEKTEVNKSEIVIENLMTRRSVRKYLPQAVNRDTMQLIANCGLYAPNGMGKQSWEVRIVDKKEFFEGMPEAVMTGNFRNAPTVAFIARDTNYGMSDIDCGMLGENMMLAAWSMGIGSCTLGSPVAFMTSEAGATYLKKLNFSEGYVLHYCIGFGYPDETPAAKERNTNKVKFID